jgi:PPOX class probable F420-dependent enzyme
MLADHYDEDWARLWWVRADGNAAIVTDQAAMAGPLRLLAARYPQYQADPPAGPVIAITVHHWTGWTAAP